MTCKLVGLVAAVHTPFDSAGELDLSVVERQLSHLLSRGVTKVFVGGSTGESQSLTVDERLRLAERWAQVSHGTEMRVVVHVGANSLPEARAMAAQAERLGALAVAAVAPSYFKPRSVPVLLDWCRSIAGAAPATPFYFYDIPVLTGVSLSMPELLESVGDSIPNFAGLKFTNQDLYAYQQCLRAAGGRYDIAFGFDEMLLAALVLGAVGAVGATYNFAAPVHHRILRAFDRGDLSAARDEQYRSVQTIRTLVRHGFAGSGKAVMEMLGVPVGPPRAPQQALDAAEIASLRAELTNLGFFDWIAAP